MSITDAIQVALYERLIGDGDLAQLVGDRVFDRVPEGATHPYVSFGPEDWPEIDAECLEAIEGSVQIDVWSRDVGRREAKRITDRVVKILKGAELQLAAPFRAVSVDIAMRRILRDPDGITTHGVVMLEIAAEEGSE